jgi:hypothetical protein
MSAPIIKDVKANLNEYANALTESLHCIVISIAGTKEIRKTPHYITLRKFEIDVTIEARYENLPISQARVTDESGNDLVEMGLVVNLTYPSHCGTDIRLAISQVNFISECCDAAMKIQERFSKPKVYEMLLTADEKERQQQKANEDVVVRAVMCNAKGLRVNQGRHFSDGTFSDKLVAGNYSISVEKKTYEVTVDSTKVVSITRTS